MGHGELEPAVGLVIRHAYLWWNEARAGREEGVKDRPCVIVHTRRNEFDEPEVFICPVTHTPPASPERAVAMPEATKKRLRLDTQPSWIITTELNRFIWPGPDIRSVPGGAEAYGVLPAAMTRDLVDQVKANARDRSLLVVGRCCLNRFACRFLGRHSEAERALSDARKQTDLRRRIRHWSQGSHRTVLS